MLGLSNRLNSSSQGGAGFKDLYSVLFDGADEYIQLGDKSAFDITGYLTLAAWVKIDSFPTSEDGIITKCNSSGEGYGLYTASSGTKVVFFPRLYNAQTAECVEAPNGGKKESYKTEMGFKNTPKKKKKKKKMKFVPWGQKKK